jgi:hypothetical protein
MPPADSDNDDADDDDARHGTKFDGLFQDRFALGLAMRLLGSDTVLRYTEGGGSEEHKNGPVSDTDLTILSPPPVLQYWRSNITLDGPSALASLYHGRVDRGMGRLPKLLFVDATFTFHGASLQLDGQNDLATNVPESNVPSVASQHRRLDCTLGFFFLMPSTTSAYGDDSGTVYGQYVPCQLTGRESPLSEESSLLGRSTSSDQSSPDSDETDALADALLHLGTEATPLEDGVKHSLVATLSSGQGDAQVVDVVIHRYRCDYDNHHNRGSTWKLTFRMDPSDDDDVSKSGGRAIFRRQQLRLLYWDLAKNRLVNVSGPTEWGKEEDTVTQKPVDDKVGSTFSTTTSLAPSSAFGISTHDKEPTPNDTKAPWGSDGGNGTGDRPIKPHGKRVRGMAPLPSGRRKRNNGRIVYGSADNANT